MLTRFLPAAMILAAAIGAGSVSPATHPAAPPTADPPTFQLKTAAQWMPAALDRDDGIRAKGVGALTKLAVVQSSLVPLLADLLMREPSADIRGSIAAELPTLVKAQPAAWARRLDAVLAAAADGELSYADEGRSAAVKAAASLAATKDATPDQRARAVKTFADLLDLREPPTSPDYYRAMYLHYTVAEGLAEVVPLDPAAAKALRDSLAASELSIRFASMAALSESEPTFTPADASAFLVREFDALHADSDSFFLGYIRNWIVKNAKPGGAVARMSPADRRAVAKAIGGVFDRLARPDSANAQGFYLGLIDGLAALGQDADPALPSVRAAVVRFKGIRESEAEPARKQLGILKGK